VDGEARRQHVALGQLGVAGFAAAEKSTLMNKVRSGGATNEAIDTPPPWSDELAALTMESTLSVAILA
jgi:hypothetical protein